MKGNRNERNTLERDAFLRQRNVVFPDTVTNEAEGYRKLIAAEKITKLQRIGATILGVCYSLLGLLLTVCGIFLPRIAREETDSLGFAAIMMVPAVALVATGIVFLVLGVRMLRRAAAP